MNANKVSARCRQLLRIFMFSSRCKIGIDKFGSWIAHQHPGGRSALPFAPLRPTVEINGGSQTITVVA